MKNTARKVFWSTLFTLLVNQVHAEIVQPVKLPSPKMAGALEQTPNIPTPPGQDLPSIKPTTKPEVVINCDYKISSDTKTIDQSLLLAWSTKAVTQAFDFDPNNLDEQMQKLQVCFTEQGWTGFNNALQKSGNLQAIKTQKLTVSSQVLGEVLIMEAKNNQWKIRVPLQVVYQNDKEKVTQLLSVDLTVGRKMSGDLGITQMIASPRGTVTQDQAPDTKSALIMNPDANTAQPTPSTNSPSSAPAPTTPPNQASPTITTTPNATSPTPSTPNPAPAPAPNPPTNSNPAAKPAGNSSQPTFTNTPSAAPGPVTPGQPTLPGKSTQPTLPPNTP
jgi:hypothetical protein